MKTKNKTNTILSALAYLIERQNLNADEIIQIILKTQKETANNEH